MRDLRVSIAGIVLTLAAVGTVMVYSSSGVYAMQELGDTGYFLKRHVLFLGAGFLAALAVMAFDYRVLRRWAKPLVLASFVVLLLVLIPSLGKESFGARRWFRLWGVSVQPSEFAKLAMLIYVSDFLARKGAEVRGFFRGFLPVLLVLGGMGGLILKQPDLGSALLITAVTLILLFIAGVRLRHLVCLVLAAFPAFYALVVRVPYRWSRVVTFLDPWRDRLGAGFQLTQSQIAFGSGGLIGVGLGHSLQKLYYLPAAHTDFILSIIGEELGFAGVSAVILLFAAFIWQGARIAKRCRDPFGYYLSCGVVAMIGLQAVVNIGVSIGTLPTKGLPLPFVSYGGSALVSNLMAVGLLLNVSRIEEWRKA